MRNLKMPILAMLAVFAAGNALAADHLPFPPVATFSILGFDPKTGEVGAAVQSRVFSVGNGVLWAEAGGGVVTTQAIVDVSYGPQGLALLRAAGTPAAFEKSEEHLSYRLLAALDAGQKAGGDTRGMQPAAMIIVKNGGA